MSSTSVITILVIVAALVTVDIFCADVANTRQSNSWQNNNNQKSVDTNINAKSTTPWPALGQRYRTTLHTTNKPTTYNPRKWIQQNNIWIKNEQASAVADNNGQHQAGNRATKQQSGTSNNNLAATTSASSAKRPLNRGDTYTVLKPQILPNNKQNLNPVTTNKPNSYAGALGTKSPSIPLSPLNPQTESKKDVIPSVGPIQQTNNNEDKDETISSDTSDVTDDELRQFSEMILKKDSNNAMKFVTLNLQGQTTSRSANDEAPLPLLQINKEAFNIPSIEKLILLHNNYFLEASQNEVYTGQERIEENNLLDTILATPVMQFARSFLIQKGKIGKDPKEFRDLLRLIWFNMYSRGQGRIGSSGFEHVFVAEIKNSQVSGLHNWIYFSEEEQQRRANYLGYMKKIDLGEKGAILKYHFTFHDIDKPVGSMFIGTSPELEIALYTTCFVLRADKICPLKMNDNRFIIRTFTYKYRGKKMIGSAFPEI